MAVRYARESDRRNTAKSLMEKLRILPDDECMGASNL